MNVKQISKEWGVTKREVIRYCSEGMVPVADRIINRLGMEDYDIPDGTPKPPCNRRQAVLMLENINAIKKENANPWIRGYSYHQLIECYSYFLDCCFISGFIKPSEEELENENVREVLREILKKCEIIERGKKQITDENESNYEKTKLSVKELNVGAKIKTNKIEGYIESKAEKNEELK